MATIVRIRGPRWLKEDYGPLYREILRPKLSALGQSLRSDARARYAGTRFVAGFGMSTATAPAARITLTQSNPLFQYVEEETRAHVIAARSGWALRFPSGGDIHFSRYVNHPGTKGKYLMPPLADEYERKFQAGLQEAAREAAFLGEV